MTRHLSWLPLALRLHRSRTAEHAREHQAAQAARDLAHEACQAQALARQQAERDWLEQRSRAPGDAALDACFQSFHALRQAQAEVALQSLRAGMARGITAQRQLEASHALEQGLERIQARRDLSAIQQGLARERQALQEATQLGRRTGAVQHAPPQDAPDAPWPHFPVKAD